MTQEWLKAQQDIFIFNKIINFQSGWVKCIKHRDDYLEKIRHVYDYFFAKILVSIYAL
jgi:hypothetical protein